MSKMSFPSLKFESVVVLCLGNSCNDILCKRLNKHVNYDVGPSAVILILIFIHYPGGLRVKKVILDLVVVLLSFFLMKLLTLIKASRRCIVTEGLKRLAPVQC